MIARARRGSLRGAGLAGCALLAVACKSGAAVNDLPDAKESPQAKAEPAPLANALLTASAQSLVFDAGPPPVALRADEAVPADTAARDATGWELEAALRTSEQPPAFRGPETSVAAIDAVKKKNEPRLVIDFTTTRARLVLGSGAFLLPADTELRARQDRYGHFVLLPDARQYRVAAPGSLRALFNERRIDVGPMVPAEVSAKGEGARRLGYRTRRVEVTSRAATATFDLARVPDAGEGGELVCRALLDLMNAPPSTPVCGLDDVPVHVEWRWATKGSLTLDATSLVRRADLTASQLAAPPTTASFVLPALPPLAADALAEPGELAAFRTGPADIGPQPDAGGPRPTAGLALANVTDQTHVAWLDGAPVAWVAPNGRLTLPTLLRGRYGFAWRTFLGDAYDAPITIVVPGAVTSGAGDAGGP